MFTEKWYDEEMLEEIAKICTYLKDKSVKEVVTNRKEIANIFRSLGYEVKDGDCGGYAIRREKEEYKNLGCYM